MSEHEHDHPHIIGVPPRIMAALEHLQSLKSMQIDTESHAVNDFLINLDPEQAKIVISLVHRSRHEKGYSDFVIGSLHMNLHYRFGICSACGETLESHEPDSILKEEAAKEEADEQETDVQSVNEQFAQQLSEVFYEDSEGGDAALDLEKIIEAAFTPAQREQMIEYGLDDVWDIETGKFLYFQCTSTSLCPSAGCGMHYVSIEDRMLRPPGIAGCSGCQLRSGHG